MLWIDSSTRDLQPANSYNCKSGEYSGVGDDSHLTFRQKLVGEDGSVRRGVDMVKQPGLFPPNFGATSSHVFTQSPQNFAAELGIHSLACWEKFFVLPQLLHKWRHQSGIFWMPPNNCCNFFRVSVDTNVEH
jgi:hypothetical protein